MTSFTPKDWGAILILFLMFLVTYLVREAGVLDRIKSPIIRESIQEVTPIEDGGAEKQTSFTATVSRAEEPFRLRLRI